MPGLGTKSAKSNELKPFEPKPVRARPEDKTLAYWNRYYLNRKEAPEKLLETVILLQQAGKMQDVEAALLGYLRNPTERAAWMYTMLAVALEHNQAPVETVQKTLVYAASLARKPEPDGDPESLLSIIDLMGMRKWYRLSTPDGKGGEITIQVGDLIDEAMKALPHRPDPMAKSMDLATIEEDPERMAVAVDGFLSLGWPGTDADWRAETRRRVEVLANTLREEGRTGEAEALLSRLGQSEIRDVYARLTWEGSEATDFDLLVDEPLGATAQATRPRTVFGGAIVQNGRGPEQEEVYVCPRGFSGAYTFRVEVVVNDPENPVERLKLEVITHEGSDQEQIQSFDLDLNDPRPIVVDLKEGRRTQVLPFVMPKVLGIKPKPPVEASTPVPLKP